MQNENFKIYNLYFALCIARVKGKVRLTLVSMVEKCVWGDVPPGFKRLSPHRGQMVLVREGLEGSLHPAEFFREGEAEQKTSPFHGRGQLRRLRLDNGESALVRGYRHGGTLRHLTGDFFFTWPPRPFKELAITEEVRRRGVPTLEVLGAGVERVGGPIYRGWLITRELKDARDLWDALQHGLYCEDDGTGLLQAVARSVRYMHRQGVYHRDLNLKNIMVRREEKQITGYIIDFDKAELFAGELPAHRIQRNLRRLLRSVCKLDPNRQRLSPGDWDLFIRFYREASAG